MRADTFENWVRRGEVFHDLRVPKPYYIVLRMDGRAFTTLTQRLALQKPFSQPFHTSMQKTMGILLEKLNGSYGYTQSDEISILLPPEWDQFGRSVDKLTSISASIASVHFALEWDAPDAHFDSRIWIGSTEEEVMDYFAWRQGDSIRNALNSWCYWLLRRSHTGSRNQIASILRKATVEQKLHLLDKSAIDFYDTENWQRNGSQAHWETYTKMGLNPKYGKEVPAQRRRVIVEPISSTGKDFTNNIKEIIKCHTSKKKID